MRRRHRCAQAKILDKGHKDEKIKGVIKKNHFSHFRTFAAGFLGK